jgi:hypothetical protein
MNWFNKQIIKTALSSGHQDEWHDDFGDFQRYMIDAYQLKCFRTKTNNKIVVSFLLYADFMGTIMFQVFWQFKKTEDELSKKTFKDVVNAVEGLNKEFIQEEIPTVNLTPALRSILWNIDNNHIAQSNNPNINYSYKVKYEGDWRKSLYGTRYPKSNTQEGF